MHELPVRVLHILGSMQRGGTESVVFNNYQYIDREKVQFDIVVDNNSPCDVPQNIQDMGCRIYRISPYTRLPAYIAAIRDICDKNHYDIVHSHMNTMSVFALFAAWLAGVPVRISHSHSTAGKGRGETKRNMIKYILRPFSRVFATHYFACSEYAARWLFGNCAVENGEAVIFKNAISAEKFCYNPDKRKAVRASLGIEEQFVIGHVGRLSPPKNHFFLIAVFNFILKECRDAYLLLVGGIGSAGEGIEQELKEKIEKYGIGDRIKCLGSLEDTSEIYQAMDVFVLPSLYEGLGIASIEAQASGLPCILSDRVPRAAKVNENVKFLSLDEPLEKWASEIISSQGIRGDYAKNIAAAGYDIKEAAKVLEDTYLKCIEGIRRESL